MGLCNPYDVELVWAVAALLAELFLPLLRFMAIALGLMHESPA